MKESSLGTQPTLCGETDIKGIHLDPVSIVEAVLKEVKLASTGDETSQLAHGKLAIVRNLARLETPAATTWHRHCIFNVHFRLPASLELEPGAKRVSHEGT